jgi:NitT/TauT family transport system substrate-binding protein
MSNIPSRRKALGQLAAMTAAPMLAASPFRHVYAQTAKQIRVGYLHIPSCDSQMWLMKEYGYWAKEGLEPVFTKFNTGIEGFSALVGGSVDVFSTGGVTHNFPAPWQGVVYCQIPSSGGGRCSGARMPGSIVG